LSVIKSEDNNDRQGFLKRCFSNTPNLRIHLVFWSIFTVGLTADLWSKQSIFFWLSQRQTSSFIIIDGFLEFVMAENSGAAFGIAAGQRYLLTAVSIVALIVIFGLFFFGRHKQKLVYIALGLFAAGICGNLWDRLFNDGRVRDFIDVVYWPGRHWPAFNIADSMLCVAVGLMIISSLRVPNRY